MIEVRDELERLLPAARHQARWDEEPMPSLAPLQEEALKRHRWIEGVEGPDRLVARAVAAGVPHVPVTITPEERAQPSA